MSNRYSSGQGSKTVAIATLATVAVGICFVAGYVMFGRSSAPHTEVPIADPAPEVVAATIPTPAVSTSVPSVAVAAINGEMEGVNLPWTTMENGTKTEQTGGSFHVTGSTVQEGWDHWNGVMTAKDFPEGDFTASVDLKVADFTGPGNRLTYLRMSSAAGVQVGIYFNPPQGYCVQAWTSPQVFSPIVKPFGDEKTTFHRVRLQYEAATQTAQGWVDDLPIGSVNAPLKGSLQFWLVTNTERSGVKMDVSFENFKVIAGTVPAPAPGTAAPAKLP